MTKTGNCFKSTKKKNNLKSRVSNLGGKKAAEEPQEPESFPER